MGQIHGAAQLDIFKNKKEIIMKNTGKIIAGVVIAAGTAIAAYYGFFYTFADGLTGWQKLTGGKKQPEISPAQDASTVDVSPSGGAVGGGSSGGGASLPAGTFPIKKGDKNALVKRLQTALKGTWKKDIGKIDGDFGSKTATALKAIGYGDNVKDNATLSDIEMKATPTVSTSSTYGVLAINKTAYATVSGTPKAYDLSRGASSSLATTKDLPIGTIKRLVGDSVYVDILGKQWSLDKKFVYTM